jgi:hypothetical protein
VATPCAISIMQVYQSDAATQFFQTIVSSTSSKILDAPRVSDFRVHYCTDDAVRSVSPQ